MNRISSRAAEGQSVDSVAATVPITVMGGMTTATARFATTETRLKVPDMPATIGAVTNCAANATTTASASGLGQPRPTSRRDQTGAITTSAAVAATDSAKPRSTANSGATIISTITLADSAGTA